MKKAFPRLPRMKETTLGEQNARQRISPTWEPNGFDRYQYSQALLREMSVLGGTQESGGCSPERYLSPTSLEEDYPIR